MTPYSKPSFLIKFCMLCLFILDTWLRVWDTCCSECCIEYVSVWLNQDDKSSTDLLSPSWHAVSLYVCISVCLFLSLSACVCVYVSMCCIEYVSVWLNQEDKSSTDLLSPPLVCCVSVCLYLCLSVYLSVCFYLCLHVSVFMSLCVYLCLYVCLYVCLCVCLCVCVCSATLRPLACCLHATEVLRVWQHHLWVSPLVGVERSSQLKMTSVYLCLIPYLLSHWCFITVHGTHVLSMHIPVFFAFTHSERQTHYVIPSVCLSLCLPVCLLSVSHIFHVMRYLFT